jgi:hypothetical protein
MKQLKFFSTFGTPLVIDGYWEGHSGGGLYNILNEYYMDVAGLGKAEKYYFFNF